jgi:hypothetical protein
MKTVAVVSDKLLIITGIDYRQLREMKAYLTEKGHDLELIGVPEGYDVLDLRAAPPAVTEAAVLVDQWLNRGEFDGSPDDPKA